MVLFLANNDESQRVIKTSEVMEAGFSFSHQEFRHVPIKLPKKTLLHI